MPLSYLLKPVGDVYIFSNSLTNASYHFSAWKKDASHPPSETGSTEVFSTSVYENPNILNSSAGHKNNMQYKLYNDILGRKQVQPELVDSVTDKLHK